MNCAKRFSQVGCRRLAFLASLTIILTASAGVSAHGQTFNLLAPFSPGEPENPQYNAIAQGFDGSMYTTTATGGTKGYGTFFKVTPGGALTVLYNFASSPGYLPFGGVSLGTDGNFYGSVENGGTAGYGFIYKITPAGALTVMHDFTGIAPDGSYPITAPTQVAGANFYGTTNSGGTNALGTIYKMTKAGVLTTIHSFKTADGEGPSALIEGTDGNLYGTASYGGGASSAGTVFRITPGGQFKVLYTFDVTHGESPNDLVQGTDGNFYGTTYKGGTSSAGVVFSMTPSGALKVLHNFTGTEGDFPAVGLVQATGGKFYGVASEALNNGGGTLFSITAQGILSVLFPFSGSVDATLPKTTLLQHTNGILYGDTYLGGTANWGTFYSLNAGLAPFARQISSSGKVGATVGLLGQGLTGSTGISFNGKVAKFTVVSNTYATATVPAGATTGLVKITTPTGSLSSKQKFRVLPQLTSFTPASGPVGSVFTIAGVSLLKTTKVTIGGVAVTSVTVNSDTKITLTVPAGAKTGKIVVTTSGGTATSATAFTVM